MNKQKNTTEKKEFRKEKTTNKTKIAIVKGKSRKENIRRAMQLIGSDIEQAIRAKKAKRLFVKINAIDSLFPLACTHVDALRTVLDFFYERFSEIIVGDNTFVFSKNRGIPYTRLKRFFPKARFSDLSEFDSEEIRFKQLDGSECSGRLCLLPKQAFTVSLALPKTHDAFVFTGCLKNMFGCVTSNRPAMHALKAYETLLTRRFVKSNELRWHNLVKVIKKTIPDLNILDAFEGMQGNGPIIGERISMETAMCSLDGIALDRLASRLCGCSKVPYLEMLPENSSGLEIVKEGFVEMAAISKQFKPHYKTKYQTAVEANKLSLFIDLKPVISLLKRPHRIKDKILKKLLG